MKLRHYLDETKRRKADHDKLMGEVSKRFSDRRILTGLSGIPKRKVANYLT